MPTTLLLRDTFTGADSTALSGRVVDANRFGNAFWTDVGFNGNAAVPGSAEISGNACIINDDARGVLIDVGYNTVVSISFTFTPAAASDNRMAVIFRSNSLGTNAERLVIREDNGDLFLSSILNGSFEAADESASFAWVEGTTYTIRIELDGTACTVYVDDVSVLTGTVDNTEARTRFGFCRLTGSSATKIDSFEITTNEAMPLMVNSSQITPQQRGPVLFPDGTEVRVVSNANGSLRCLIGMKGEPLEPFYLDGDNGYIGNVQNTGKAYSVLAIKLGSQWYLVIAVSQTTTSNSLWYRRWQVSNGTMTNPVTYNPIIVDKPNAALHFNPSGDLVDPEKLLVTLAEYDGNINVRSIETDLSIDQGETAFDPPREFPEIAMFSKVTDGYRFDMIDNGQPGDSYTNAGTSHYRYKLTLGGVWVLDTGDVDFETTGSGEGTHQKASYAVAESHKGQTVIVRLDNGTALSVKIADNDTVAGNYGQVDALTRGATVSGGWTVLGTNITSGFARSLALTTDGVDGYLVVLPDDNDARADHLQLYKIVVATGQVFDLGTIWTAPAGVTPQRINMPPKFLGNEIPINVHDTEDKTWGIIVQPVGYKVYKRSTVSSASELVTELPPDVLSYTLTGLTANSIQYYYVNAVSACGVESTIKPSSRMRKVAMDGSNALIPPAPNATSDVTLKTGQGGAVSVSWRHSNANAEADVGGFNVYVATGATAFDYDTIDYAIGSSVFKQDLGTFADGTTVRCVVRARTAGGVEETNTTEATAVADAAAPSAPVTITFE